jgi:ABC-type lipoprotein release transport system permease subunit
VPAAGGAELVFVIDVSSFTENGFVGVTPYQGKRVNLEFDDKGEGVFLTPEMAARLQVREGSRLTLMLEDGSSGAVELTVAGVGSKLRISDPRAYYGVGREGGAVLRLRRA